MNNRAAARAIGISRQMLEATISGKRNLGFIAAKRAAQVFGGTVEVWMDPELIGARRAILERFKNGG